MVGVKGSHINCVLLTFEDPPPTGHELPRNYPSSLFVNLSDNAGIVINIRPYIQKLVLLRSNIFELLVRYNTFNFNSITLLYKHQAAGTLL